jgi:hypothetical protein
MLGLKLISKRELALYAAQIQELREQNARLALQIEHERKRAEGAINLLLMRTVKAAITPNEGITMQQEEELKAKQYDIFGDNNPINEDEALEKIQS